MTEQVVDGAGSRRIPMSDGWSRARRRRDLIRDMLRGYIECSLRWMQTGCVIDTGKKIGSKWVENTKRPKQFGNAMSIVCYRSENRRIEM